jgi:hypothetical protein
LKNEREERIRKIGHCDKEPAGPEGPQMLAVALGIYPSDSTAFITLRRVLAETIFGRLRRGTPWLSKRQRAWQLEQYSECKAQPSGRMITLHRAGVLTLPAVTCGL